MNIDRIPWIFRTVFLLQVILTLFLPHHCMAAEEAVSAKRSRIGLVLGGGGARGAAHVGVLKVLEELRIPVDVIAGTSMGSIVGGLYAMGLSPEQIEREMLAMEWRDLFSDEPPREDRSFRRKRDDDYYTVKAKPGLKDGEVRMPMGFLHGQKFDIELNRLTLPVARIKNFDQLPIPYRAVGTDIETGEAVILGSGKLSQAIRASMAVPSAFDPVEIDGRLLVDGGLAANVPVSVAREMGAEIFIVVDVGSGLFGREEINSALDITAQLANFLFTLSGDRDIRTLSDGDVLIKPPLGDIGGGSFDRVGEAIPIGEQATLQMRDALARYSLSDKEYYAHLEQRGRFAREDREEEALAFIRIENRSRVADDVIRDRITQQSGEPLDIDRLETDISHIYGLDLFSSVRYEIVEENGAEGLVVSAAGKDWRPAYLQAGLAFSSNLSDESGFQVGALYTRTQLNSLNGELRLGVQLADEPAILTEIYQPLDPAGRYFLNARASYGGTNVNVFDEDYHRQAREFVTAWDIDLAGGREFGTWGEIFLGYRLGGGEIERSIGEQVPDRRFDVGEAVLGLRGDTLDNLYFPTSGWLGWAEWHGSREGIGADQDFDQFRLGYNQAFSRGKNSLIVSALANTTLDDEAPVQNLYRLGGFLRLSGLQEQQLSGQHSGLARLVYLHRVQDAQFFQSYLGMSLEAGNVWQREEDIGLDNSLAGGSVFLGLDTPIGPFFLGYGLAEGGESSFYLYLGPLFSFGN